MRVTQAVETVADVLGEETNTLLEEMRKEFEAELGQLRAEIATLRGYMQASNQIEEMKRAIEYSAPATVMCST
jgi:hypothetical protein